MAYEKAPTEVGALQSLVARTRFELVISALRGRRPKPLDERAICSKCNGWDGGSRTPIDGTRIRCPAIRRHPSGITRQPACDQIYYGSLFPHARGFLHLFELWTSCVCENCGATAGASPYWMLLRGIAYLASGVSSALCA